jgi:hypothetical protein
MHMVLKALVMSRNTTPVKPLFTKIPGHSFNKAPNCRDVLCPGQNPNSSFCCNPHLPT